MGSSFRWNDGFVCGASYGDYAVANSASPTASTTVN